MRLILLSSILIYAGCRSIHFELIQNLFILLFKIEKNPKKIIRNHIKSFQFKQQKDESFSKVFKENVELVSRSQPNLYLTVGVPISC